MHAIECEICLWFFGFRGAGANSVVVDLRTVMIMSLLSPLSGACDDSS
jgi:hypothetical protein